MNKSFTDKNIAQIQQYINGELSAEERTAFEQAMAKDDELKTLVDHYKLMKEGFELKELMDRRKQLQLINAIAAEAPNTEQSNKNHRRTTRLLSLKRVANYAAIFALCFFVGRELMQQFGTAEEDLYAGNSGDVVVLYDNNTPFIKLHLTNEGIIRDSAAVNLIISKTDEPKTRYNIEPDFLEIILATKDVPFDQLEEVDISLILEKIDTPPFQVGLLTIGQTTHSISFKDEDFKQLFN